MGDEMPVRHGVGSQVGKKSGRKGPLLICLCPMPDEQGGFPVVVFSAIGSIAFSYKKISA